MVSLTRSIYSVILEDIRSKGKRSAVLTGFCEVKYGDVVKIFAAYIADREGFLIYMEWRGSLSRPKGVHLRNA